MAIGYTEMASAAFAAGADASWEDYDIFTNLSVPKGAVAEILIGNKADATENEGGVRTDGSGLARKVDIMKAEDGGLALVCMLVQVDSSTGLIELYAEVDADIEFRCVGYFTGCTFTEAFNTFQTVGGAAWEDKGLFTDYGTPKGSACQVIAGNNQNAINLNMGVRTDGSALLRQYSIREAEDGGESLVSFIVKSDATTGKIEVYDVVGAMGNFHYVGYFDDGVGFTEAWDLLDDPVGGDGVWSDDDLTDDGAPDNAIVSIHIGHDDEDAETECGVRSKNSALDRKYEFHETETVVGRIGTCITVNADANAVVEIYCEDVSESFFYYAGYFSDTAAGVDYFQTIEDILGMVDSSPIVASFHLTTSDRLGLLESIEPRRDFKQSIMDYLGMSDLVPLLIRSRSQTFGNENEGTNFASTRALIRGSWFECPFDGTADSITVYLNASNGDSNVKCAIYNYGLGAAEPGTLVAATEERLILEGKRWETFNFLGSPSLSGGVKYFLVAWSPFPILMYAYYEPDVDDKCFVTSEEYNDFPSPPAPERTDPFNHLYSIYCTYTTTGGIPLYQTIEDILGMDESITKRADFQVEAEEILGLLDSAAAAGNLHITVVDQLSMLDTLAARSDRKQAVAETLGLLDSVAKRADMKQEVIELLGMLDTVWWPEAVAYYVTVMESLGMLDTVSPRCDYKQLVIDYLGMVDSIWWRPSILRGFVSILSRSGAVGISSRRGEVTQKDKAQRPV